MPQVGWLDEKDQPVPFERALTEAHDTGSWRDFPYEVLLGIYRQVTKERPDSITVTQLLGCPRKVFLEANTEFYVAPQDNYAAFRGSIVHALLEENKPDDAVTEERVEREHRGVVISGQADSVRPQPAKSGRTLLRDWKSTNKLPLYDNAYSHHQQQGNLYRWLRNLDWRLTDIEIVYLSMEGVKAIALKRGGQSRTGRAIPMQVWTDQEVEDFLDRKLLVLDAQRKHGAPVAYHNVPEDDLWQCDYCPVKRDCYARAADEAKVAWATGEPVNRVPPRSKKEKK